MHRLCIESEYHRGGTRAQPRIAEEDSPEPMNDYLPYQNQCASNPTVMADLQTSNSHISLDASAYSVPTAVVFSDFGGATTSDICSYYLNVQHLQ